MIISSSQSLAAYPNSRVAKENLDVFCHFWEQQINDFSILVKEIQDFIEGRGEKTVYLSLPRPGKHGTTSKDGFKPTKLDSDEQAKIAKAGLEMKLVTSEMDAEAEKWDEPQNEIAKVCYRTFLNIILCIFHMHSVQKICHQWRFQFIYLHEAKELYVQHKIYSLKLIILLKKVLVYQLVFTSLFIK